MEEALDLRSAIAEASLESFAGDNLDPFAPLDRLIDAVEETRQLQGLADVSGEALTLPQLDPSRYYLHAFSLSRLGRTEEAAKVLISLCGKLEQEGRWETLGLLLPRILDEAPSVEAARSLAKLCETKGSTAASSEAVAKAYELYPDEERLAYIMGELAAAAGDLVAARRYWAESLDGFVRSRKHERVEETMLKVVDAEQPEPEDMRHVVNVLHRLVEQNQWSRFSNLLELSMEAISKSGLLIDVWRILLHVFPKAPEEAGLRKWIRRLAPEAFPAAEGILDLLGRSGILDPQIRSETSIKQLEALLEFAPGFHVLHASWGIGKVRLNDGDTLVVDFKDTKNHRMKLTLARRALQVLPPTDLRVLQSEDPDELKRLVKEFPGEIIVRVLGMLRGEASTQDLRKQLTGLGVISASAWSGWWKEAKTALEADDRVDLTQSFRQLYRLRAVGGEDEDLLALPIIEPRRGIRPNLNLIKRFLEQHQEENARAARMYTPILERWARDEKASPDDRMAIQLQLYRWRKQIRDDFVAALEACLEKQVEMSAFSDLEDQRLLAETALGSKDLWQLGALFVLSSRSEDVRRLARERMERDPDESRSLLVDLLREPAGRPQAALFVLEMSLEDPLPPYAPEPWQAAMAAALLVDLATKDPVRKHALGWLSTHGPLARKLAEQESRFENTDRWINVLRRWRSSEHYLKPILDFLGATGQTGVVEAIRNAHVERTERILGAQGATAVDYRGRIMTRPTYAKLLHHRNWLVWELKTTVAKAIQKARELGDLRENAEYESAKLKQADYAHQITDISERLAEAKLVENLQVPPDEAAPGMEILVEDVVTEEHRTYWLLGEGDDWLGTNVISYAAPLGRNLLGKKVGERVNVVGSDSVHEFIIRSLTKKHPQVEEKAEDLVVTEDDLKEIEATIHDEVGPEGFAGSGS